MNHSSNDADATCFTNFALQEYLLGRLGQDVRAELKQHVDDCPQCGACLTLMDTETQVLRAALRDDSGEAENPKLDTETLAIYLDGSLSDEQREECERVLISSPQLLASLVDIRRELSTLRVLDPNVLGASERPEGRILRMPKRRLLPKDISELSLTDSEAAEA